jgi:branched-chain amino acid transport system permease protein
VSFEDILAFFILGLGGGATYAALGVGVVMTYRASGLVNFAHGAMALYTVALMSQLRATGQLVLPIGTIDLGDSMGTWQAAAIAIAYSAVQSSVLYLFCFAPLHKAPPLAKVVASVGVMIAMQSLINIRFHTPRAMAPILPNEPIDFLGVTVARDRLFLAAFVLAGAGLIAAWGTYTVFGKATRAGAEDERGAYLVGLRPQRIALVNWILAGVLATAAGILIAPIGSLESSTFTLLIVPALAAALVGRLSSVMVTAVAGLALGGIQSVLLLGTQSYSWLPQTGLKEGLPFVVVMLVMWFLGNRLPGRDTIIQQRLPSAPGDPVKAASTLLLAVVAVICLFVFPSTWQLALITSMTSAVLCLGLVVVTGFVGQMSLAHMTLAGLAGFTLSRLAVGWGLPFPIAPLLAVAVSVIAGVILGYPALRVRGLHLAVVSIAGAVAIEEFLFKNPEYTGGLAGSSVPQPELFGWSFGIRGGVADFPRPVFGLFVMVVLVASALGVAKLRRSDLGRRMLAVRSDERAATAAGIDVGRTRLIAIAISAGLAGLGGCLVGYQQGQLSYTSFTVFASLAVFTAAYLGGIASVTGALVGGALYSGGLGPTALDRWLHLGRYESVILGFALVATAIANPDGIVGAIRHARRALTARRHHDRSGDAAILPVDAVAQPVGGVR